MQIAGAAIGASQANKRAKKLEAIANTPGVDLASVYSDTTKAGLAGLGGANELASGLNRGAQTDLTGILNTAIPGYSDMQASRAGAVGSMLKGEIPQDVQDAVFRSGAARGVAGGFAGSDFGRNLVARDLGLTSLDILGKGMSGMSSMIGSTPMARMTQANDILNVSGRDTMGLRSGERSEKLSMLTTAAQAPRSGDVWAKALTDMGGQASGMGGGMGGGGGGGGMGGIGSILGILGMI